jgi:hypothetical protein
LDLSRPKQKKTPFLTEGREKDNKGPKKDKKGPKRDKRFIIIYLFQKGQKGQEKTKKIKGTPLGFYTR